MTISDAYPLQHQVSGLGDDTIRSEVIARLDLVRRIRAKMRDYPQLNQLVEGEENDDQCILDAIEEVLSRVNETPPAVGFFLAQNVPLYLMMDGAIAILLESAAFLYIRNELGGWSSGGLSVSFRQADTYRQSAAQVFERFESNLMRYKVALNHQQAVDASSGIASDYAVLNRPLRYYLSEVFNGANSSYFFQPN